MDYDYLHNTHSDLESFRKGTSDFFKRKAGFQKNFQGTVLRPGQVAAARRGMGSGHGEDKHSQQEVRMEAQ